MKELPEISTKTSAEETVPENGAPSPDGQVSEAGTQAPAEPDPGEEMTSPAESGTGQEMTPPADPASDQEMAPPEEPKTDQEMTPQAEPASDQEVTLQAAHGQGPDEFEFKPLFSARTQSILLVVLPALFLAVLLFFPLSGRIPRRKPEEKIDRTPPSIMLTRDNKYFVYPGEEYEEEGYAAYDNLDGDLTKKVEVSVSDGMVRYRVTDNAGNTTVRFRRIPYADRDSDSE